MKVLHNLICAGNLTVETENGKIINVIDGYHPETEGEFDNIYKYENCILTQGFVDVHVHLREPGFPKKETIATGTTAAAKGGYTAVCSMPNLNPVPDCLEHLRVQTEIIKEDAVVKVYPYGAITQGEQGKILADMEDMSRQVFAYSDDGKGIQSRNMMRDAMLEAKRLNKIICAHTEDEGYLDGGYINKCKYAEVNKHKSIPNACEWSHVMRDVELVRETGCRYHVCHVSTGFSAEILRRAKAEGLPVSGETAPHYLVLCDEDLREDGRFKMNPPLRSREDMEALLKAIKDGTIEVIATDHAPHTAEEKAKGLENSPFGIVGLETAFPILFTHLVLKGHLSLPELLKLMSANPRKIFGLEKGLKVGNCADITILNLDDEYVINPEDFASKGRATPFDGWKVRGSVAATFVDGNAVYQK